MPRYVERVAVPPARKAALQQPPAPRHAGSGRGPLWHAIQLKAAKSAAAAAKAESGSGLPAPLKAGIECLSGLAMDDVRVHRNSAEPAKLGALAYAQGSDIHLGPGQERHLPHEAWHVVQQKQGRVAATAQLKGAAVNDSPALEAEADAMGAKALAAAGADPAGVGATRAAAPVPQGAAPFQFRLLTFRPDTDKYEGVVATLHAMAQALEKVTSAGYTFVADELAGYFKGTQFTFDKYVCSTDKRINHYYNCLQGKNDSLKAAAAGYMIEDIVTSAFGTTTGYTSQYEVSGARPDFLIEAVDSKTGKKARGVVDITSEKEAGHILDKDFSTSSYDYAAECLYPNLDFETGAKLVLDPKSAPTARQVQIGRANEYVASQLNNIWKLADLCDSSIYDFQHKATTVKKSIRTLSKKTDFVPQDIAAVDDNIGALNAHLTPGPDTVAQVLSVARQKYGLSGYPQSWALPSQTTNTTSSSLTSLTSFTQSSAVPVTPTITSSSSQTPSPTSQQMVTTSSSPQSPAPSTQSFNPFSSSSSYFPSSFSLSSFPPTIVTTNSNAPSSSQGSFTQPQQKQQLQELQKQQQEPQPMAISKTTD